MKLTDRQITKATYSSWDFQQALSALTFLLEDCDFNAKYAPVELRRFRCYETTLIISLARPFESARRGTMVSLKVIGIRLDVNETMLLEKVMHLRRKIVAHSDEEEMHFRSSTFPVLDGQFNFPHFQFNESLHFGESDLREIELLLRKMMHGIMKFFFDLSQQEPSRLEAYMAPARLEDK